VWYGANIALILILVVVKTISYQHQGYFMMEMTWRTRDVTHITKLIFVYTLDFRSFFGT